MNPASRLLLAAIRSYKRRVSPRKGFACAYRVHLGACSCSTLGLRAVSRYGAWRGLGVLRLRLRQCRLVADELRARPFIARPAQAGFTDCELPCDDACDASSCALGDDADAVGCLDCEDCDYCGFPWSRRSRASAPRRRRRGDPVAGSPPSAPPEELPRLWK